MSMPFVLTVLGVIQSVICKCIFPTLLVTTKCISLSNMRYILSCLVDVISVDLRVLKMRTSANSGLIEQPPCIHET